MYGALKKRITQMLFIFGLFLFFPASEIHAQKPSKRTQKLFENAIAAYRSGDAELAENFILKAIKSDTLYVEAYLLLADISIEMKNINRQQWALEKVLEINQTEYPLAYKLLAVIYFNQGNYQQSLQSVDNYRAFNIKKDSVFVAEMLKKCHSAQNLIDNKRDVEIIHFDTIINTLENEYWPFIAADDSVLYFTRLITNEQRFHFERLFYSTRDSVGWSLAEKLSFDSNSEVNEGTLSMTSDGRLVFFTACGRGDGYGSCDIYFMFKSADEWSQPINAGPVVNTKFWEAQPSVSAHGDYLYWTSNRPGGIGAKDIWKSPILENTNGKLTFGEPQNLGKGVNSKQHDYSPFIHADGKTLYFASDGRYSLGDADLYLSRFDGEGWSPAINLGYPINSREQDDGLVVSPTAHVAVFSSNRTGSIGGSKDLYLIKLPGDLLPQSTGYVKGFVYDAVTKAKLDATIDLTNIDSKVNRMLIADNTDGYITTLAEKTLYAFNIAKQGYLFYSHHFNLKEPGNFRDAAIFDINLQPISTDAKVVLNNIFFDHDSFTIKEGSEIELDQLVDFLKLNARINIEISGHTDNLGSKAYNLKLSENRAKAIAEYLQQKIDPQRITYRGYGAEMPVADNETVEGRSKNRRSELRIVGF